MKDLSGETIRGYNVLERIGEGGFGIVYRAHQPIVKRDVVIKAILPLYANNPDFIRSFEAEAQLIARLEHLHIVPLYDYWRGSEGAFLVMRWLRGGSLADSAAGPWTLNSVVRLLDQIAGALATAHRNHIIHQDIKPANILLDQEGNAYLTDFGLAKDLDEGIDLSVSTLNTSVRGSPAYISPEQIRRSTVTSRTDIYSLGIVLYELLSGEHPYGTASLVELLRHQLNSPLPSIQKHRPDLPDSINFVLRKATAKDPDVRYASIIEMAEAFRQAAAEAIEGPILSTGAQSSPTAKADSTTGLISLASIEALLTGPPNPYKGLRPFQEADTADFFGRDELVRSLQDRLTETGDGHRFLAVVGPSGSGKSSVVYAGLIPSIRRGEINPWQRWFIVDMTPGPKPLVELEDNLQAIATRPVSSIGAILKDEEGLNRILHDILPDKETEVILVIDQFEEVFTQIPEENERAHFLKLLYHAITESQSRLRVIITLRADFYDRPLLYPGFGELVRKRTEVVLPMSAAELRKAIIGPAERVGLTLAPGLADQMVADVLNQPSALPMLQFTLAELYDHRKQDQLPVEAYAAIGGVSGALARRADEIYDALTARQQAITQQVFLRLIAPGEGSVDTRRRVLQNELISLATDEADTQQVIDIFGKHRLLTFDRDPMTRAPTVEIAHEALIHHWGKLQDWLSQNRDDLRTHRQLASTASDWLIAGKDRSFLAAGARLAQFETLSQSNTLALNEGEQAYLDASLRQREQASRRHQYTVIGLTALSLLLLVLLGAAVYQSNRADAARQVANASQATAIAERDRADQSARVAASRELAASALLAGDQPDLALLLEREALATASTFEARNSLLTTLQRYARLDTVLTGHTDWIRSVAFSPDGRYIASGGRDGSIHLWDVNTRRPATPPLTGHNAWVNTVAFSPDGSKLASGAEDGSLLIWDLNHPDSPEQHLAGHTSAIWSVAFSPTDEHLASAGADSTVRLWDIHTGEQIATGTGHQGTIYAIAFSPDGTQLASGGADNAIRLWDAETLVENRVLQGHANWVFALAFSADGRLLASGGADNTIRLWDTDTGQQHANPLQGHTNWVRTLGFVPDTQRLVSGSADGLILIWDLTNPAVPVDGFSAAGNQVVWSLAISPDSRLIATGGTNPALYIWNSRFQPGLGQPVAIEPEQVLALAVNPTGDTLTAAGGLADNFDITLWQTSHHTQQMILRGHGDQVTSLAFHPNKPWLASGSLDHTAIIWDLNTGEKIRTLQAPDSIFALSFRPDGEQLAIGDNTGDITLWSINDDPDTWSASQPLTGHTDRVLSIAYQPGGTLLASGSSDSTIRLWDSSTGQLLGQPLTGHTDGIRSLSFNPDGSLLASASRDTTIRLWSQTDSGWGPSGEPLRGHDNWVMDVDFSPDGSMLASAGGDQAVILWDVQQRGALGQPLQGHSDWVNTLAFSPDGTHLFSGGRDGLLIQWDTGLDNWLARACHLANRNLTDDEQRRYFQEHHSQMITCPNLISENP